jgi:hypothetical protein
MMRKQITTALARSLFACGLLVSSAAYTDVQASPADSTRPTKKFAISNNAMRPLVGPMGGAFATDRITVDARPVGYMYREKPTRKEDSGWRFFAGDEDQAYIDDLSHTEIYNVNTIANYDPDIIQFLDTPAPCAFEKIPGTKKYRRVK